MWHAEIADDTRSKLYRAKFAALLRLLHCCWKQDGFTDRSKSMDHLTVWKLIQCIACWRISGTSACMKIFCTISKTSSWWSFPCTTVIIIQTSISIRDEYYTGCFFRNNGYRAKSQEEPSTADVQFINDTCLPAHLTLDRLVSPL